MDVIEITDEQSALVGVGMPVAVRNSGCPDCGHDTLQTSVVMSRAETYVVGDTPVNYVGESELVSHEGYSFVQCAKCSATIIEDGAVVHDELQ